MPMEADKTEAELRAICDLAFANFDLVAREECPPASYEKYEVARKLFEEARAKYFKYRTEKK
jgi:BMFP domain-containing protein YqiC